MKKIFLSLIAVMATMSINAQVIKVFENGELSATYTNSSTNTVKVVFEEAPAPAPDGYVEIGGLKWATMNLGATTVADSPETAYGDYYACGATETWYSSISWSGNEPTFTWKNDYTDGYTLSHKPTVAGNTLSATEDIATITYPGWRTPTSADFKALADACNTGSDSYTFTKIASTAPIPTARGIYSIEARTETYKVAGMLFIDSNGASVFFPAAGRGSNAKVINGGGCGFYWSSSLDTSDTDYAYALYFNLSNIIPKNEYMRYYGYTVRPVSN